MLPSIYRFLNEQDPARHKGYLVWSSLRYSKFPVRLSNEKDVGILTDDEWKKKIYIAADYHSFTFDMSKTEDREYYLWVKERIKNKWFSQEKINYKWLQSHPVIYLEWTQYYTEFA